MENHNFRIISALLVLLFLTTTVREALAQQTEYFRVMTRRGETWQPLPVDSIGIRIRGMGSQVAVTYEFRIYNPFRDDMEGQALLPIPAGLRISGFALETEGKMREASVVDARLGRTAYEDIVRRQVDPGLLEMLGPDIYKLRIFPLPAQGFRTVSIDLEGSLSFDGTHLSLPLHLPPNAPKADLNIVWEGNSDQPFLSPQPVEWTTSTQQGRSIFTWQGPSSAPGTHPQLMIPYEFSAPKLWKDPSGWMYLEIPAIGTSREFLEAKSVTIYWDQSASMASFDRQRAIDLLESWFNTLAPTTVEVIPFHLRAGTPTSFRAPSEAEAFRAFLASIPFDGAADWSQLRFDHPDMDQYILVTDGKTVLSPQEFPTVSAPVYVLSSTDMATASHPLNGFTATSHGLSIGIDGNQPEEAAAKLRRSVFGVRAIEGDNSRSWLPMDLSPEAGLFRFCGKPNDRETSISIVLGDKQAQQKIPVPLVGDATSTVLDIERIHARTRVSQQLLSPSPDQDLMARLGVDFNLVTPVTSLLVMEQLSDYVTYRVEPPDHMKKDYDRLVKEAEREKELKLLSHLDLVAEAYQLRKDWWNRTFTPGPIQEKPQDRAEHEEADMYMSAPPSVAPAEDMMAEDVLLNRIVITEETGAQSTMEDWGSDGDPEESDNGEAPDIEIRLEAWSSDASYLPLLKRAGENWYDTYLSYKAQHATSPGFFIDIANWRLEERDTLMSIQILSNLAEMAPGDHELLRSLGRKLQQHGEWTLAEAVFRQVLFLRPEEPQSFRDLGLLAAKQGKITRAVDLLYEVVTTSWADRFPEISVLAAQEMNAIIGQADENYDKSGIDPRLRNNLPTDLRVVLQWDQNDIDMDLWVTDPRGERCLYSNRETEAGGWMSNDFTGGYGPEEYMIKTAIPGTYKVEVNYYGNSRQEMSRPVLVQVRLIRDYGKLTQQEQSITRELASASETITIGEFEVE